VLDEDAADYRARVAYCVAYRYFLAVRVVSGAVGAGAAQDVTNLLSDAMNSACAGFGDVVDLALEAVKAGEPLDAKRDLPLADPVERAVRQYVDPTSPTVPSDLPPAPELPAAQRAIVWCCRCGDWACGGCGGDAPPPRGRRYGDPAPPPVLRDLPPASELRGEDHRLFSPADDARIIDYFNGHEAAWKLPRTTSFDTGPSTRVEEQPVPLVSSSFEQFRQGDAPPGTTRARRSTGWPPGGSCSRLRPRLRRRLNGSGK